MVNLKAILVLSELEYESVRNGVVPAIGFYEAATLGAPICTLGRRSVLFCSVRFVRS